MLLLIRDYLSMLKESGELDSLVSDLVLSMGMEIISKPQIGVRQYGVDIECFGKEANGKKKCRFLFVIKPGDISRHDWDSGEQAVRQTLNEISDVYLKQPCDPKYKNIPIQIVLCAGGDLKQNVKPNWDGYVAQNTGDNVNYQFWGGDKLASLIEEFLFNENLFKNDAQANLRKCLALIDLQDYDLKHFYDLIQNILFENEFNKLKQKQYERKRLKTLRALNLSLSIITRWAQKNKNVKSAYIASEYALLRTWDWVKTLNLFEYKSTISEFLRLWSIHNSVGRTYFDHLQSRCYIRDGMYRLSVSRQENVILIFEAIGILSVIGISQLQMGVFIKNHQAIENAKAVSDVLWAAIKNNPSSYLPCYDGQAIEISLALNLLYSMEKREEMSEWIMGLINCIAFGYQTGQRYPISSDSYDDLIEIEFNESVDKDEKFAISELLIQLAQWCAILNDETLYNDVSNKIRDTFHKINLQLWYPDNDTEDCLYKGNASVSGVALSSLILPETMLEMQCEIRKQHKQFFSIEMLSCLKYGMPLMPMIASRLFRTPLIPIYWQGFMKGIE